jgi:hypothetical protein
MKLMYNDDYVFGVSGASVWCAPRPKYWTAPTLSLHGMGSTETTVPSTVVRKAKLRKNVNDEGILTVAIDNSDGTYDNPGSDALATLINGAHIKLYTGVEVNGVEHTVENDGLFIDYIGHGRMDNVAYLLIVAVDGWGVLNDHTFNHPILINPIQYNPLYYTTRYTAYEFIEMIVNACGLTLENRCKSTFIDRFYPNIVINTGDTYGEKVRGVLAKCNDSLIFKGTKGIIIDTKTTDGPTHKMLFPMQ